MDLASDNGKFQWHIKWQLNLPFSKRPHNFLLSSEARKTAHNSHVVCCRRGEKQLYTIPPHQMEVWEIIWTRECRRVFLREWGEIAKITLRCKFLLIQQCVLAHLQKQITSSWWQGWLVGNGLSPNNFNNKYLTWFREQPGRKHVTAIHCHL